MTILVADTSGLVSLSTATDHSPSPLDCCLDTDNVHVPAIVVEELRGIASYDDAHGDAATTALDQLNTMTSTSTTLDADFPLDDGENAAVTLANEIDAALFLCDECNSLGLTTPHSLTPTS